MQQHHGLRSLVPQWFLEFVSSCYAPNCAPTVKFLTAQGVYPCEGVSRPFAMFENQPGELGAPRLPGSAPGGGQAQGAPSPGMGFTFRPTGREALPGDKLEGGAVSFEDFREDIRRRMG